MNKLYKAFWSRLCIGLTVIVIVSIGCGRAHGEQSAVTGTETAETAPAEKKSSTPSVPLGAQALIDSYPDFIKGYTDGRIIFTDGTTMIYDDGKKKSFEVMLDNSDPEAIVS